MVIRYLFTEEVDLIDNNGNGIYVYNTELQAFDLLITGHSIDANWAGYGGAGIVIINSNNFELHNSIIANNMVTVGDGVFANSGVGGIFSDKVQI